MSDKYVWKYLEIVLILKRILEENNKIADCVR
jgi:hypothetical protein